MKAIGKGSGLAVIMQFWDQEVSPKYKCNQWQDTKKDNNYWHDKLFIEVNRCILSNNMENLFELISFWNYNFIARIVTELATI